MVAGNLPPDGPPPAEAVSGTFPLGYAIAAPTISIARAPASGAHALDVTFTPTNGGGNVESFTWNWGDGTSYVGSGTPAVVHHIYVNAGTYIAVLTVQNAVAVVSSATVSTTVT